MKALKFLAAATVAIISASAAQAQDESFDSWRAGFHERLLAAGAEPDTASSMLDGLAPDNRIIDRDRSQPEFVRPIWSYLGIAASDLRISNGREAHGDTRAELNAISERFGVPAEILVAIWGLESSYGAITGNNDTIRSLATLAWEGRRRSWAEAQLIAVAEMIDEGYATREQLTGSWAGAMG